MAAYTSVLLWTADGRVRSKANPTAIFPNAQRPGRWDPRRVVLIAADYQAAHEAAAPTMLSTWSAAPHEVEIYAVRPATETDLRDFKFQSDPGLRVLAEASID